MFVPEQRQPGITDHALHLSVYIIHNIEYYVPNIRFVFELSDDNIESTLIECVADPVHGSFVSLAHIKRTRPATIQFKRAPVDAAAARAINEI